MPDRPATLVLSGGGGKGAFQVGAERVLREERGFRWERIFGVSVGALNATLLAQQAYSQLRELWLRLREEDIYRKYPWPIVAIRVGMRKLGFYDNSPLRGLIQRHAAGRPFLTPAHIGRVSLISGEYEMVPNTAPDFLDAVWHSATMPVVWEAIGPQGYVDGGLRNVTPLGDALSYEPSEIVVLACESGVLSPMKPPANVLDVSKRSLVEVTINEILRNDINEFIRINDLVRQGLEAGLTLKKQDGTPYRYCRITVVEPAQPLGDTLDFSQESIRWRMNHGEEMARKAILPTGLGPGQRPPIEEAPEPTPHPPG
ncbi:MAG TPA: patatin-like phospholipase family protein [Hyalangium sp.]|nr:patatin-like phospholipase family protein [Hyalangium sp.]